MRPHHRIWLFVLLLLCGCDMHDPAKQKSESESEQQWARESQLLEDPEIARPELVRRLRAAVSMRDGLLVVKSQLGLGIAILPAAAPWVVTCNVVQISAQFGSVVAGHDGPAVADALNVPLIFSVRTPIPNETCAELGTAIAHEIQAIIAGG
jgi:hypothetical protein